MSSVSTEVCSVDCGTHGVCMGGSCRCEEGWTGEACDQRVCSPLCVKHGTCKDGKCECHQGWNGEHCTIGKYIVRASLCPFIHTHPLSLDTVPVLSHSFKATEHWEGQGPSLVEKKHSNQLEKGICCHKISSIYAHLKQLIISIASPLWSG